MTTIPEESYTKIPNALLEKLASTSMPGEQWRVLMAIVRKTYGWDNKSDWISLSQFSKMTGISKRNVLRAVNAMKNRQIIVVRKENKKHPIYRINVKYEQWKTLSRQTPSLSGKRTKANEAPDIEGNNLNSDDSQVVSSTRTNVLRSDNESFSDLTPTKEPITKETTTTTESGGGENLSFENQDQLSGETVRYGLSPEQLEYIDLKVEADAAAGKIRSTKSAYRHGLIKRAKDGLLDMSDMDELRQANQPRKYFNPETDLYADEPGAIRIIEAMPLDEVEKLLRKALAMEGADVPFNFEYDGVECGVDRDSFIFTIREEMPELYQKVVTAFPDGTVKEVVDF